MSLESILNPGSVAVIGASKSSTKRGFQAIRTLLEEGFGGAIYPVNPKEKNILGLKCYPNVSAIQDPVDLALITTPVGTVASVLDDCGRKKVKGAVIVAGGFGEAGEEGRRLESSVVDAARKNGIRLIGPNTSGMLNLNTRCNLVGLRDAPAGDIALLSQSGNMALTLITEARIKSRKGFSYYVGVGNEADIKFHEYLEFFRNDASTRGILMYVEGMRNGRRFLQEAYQTTIEKPIVLLKGGRSLTGSRSAGSHTGALTGMSRVALGAFRRAGIITVERSDELFPAMECLTSLPPLKEKRIAILADGGGHATIVADLLADLGVEVPPLTQATQNRLRKILPANAAVTNPVDVAGGTDADPSVFADCAEAILKDRDIAGLLVVGLFGGYGIRFDPSLAFAEEDAAHRMGKLVKARHKPIIVHSLYSFQKPHPLDLLRYYNIPVYDSLDVACKCMAVLGEYGQYLNTYHSRANFVLQWGRRARSKAVKLIRQARKEGRDALLEHEAKAIFREHGVPVPREEVAADAEEAVRMAEEMGGPVAMKIVSPHILHKSDTGGVRLHVQGAEEVRAAFGQIVENARSQRPDADIRGVLVTPMVEKGVEVIIGTKIDDQFGPVIMFGLGGIMVEALKDVAFRVLPISHHTAPKLIQEIRTARLLDGFRGSPPCDKNALVRLLLTISEVVEAYRDIQEMDLNPVIVHEKGLSIADAGILLKHRT